MVLKTKTYDVGSSSDSDENENSDKVIRPQKEMVFEIDEDDSENNDMEDQGGEWNVQGEEESGEDEDENSDAKSSSSSSSDEGDDKPMPMPESLSRIFESKDILQDYTMSGAQRESVALSIFNKVTRLGVDTGMTSENVNENRLKKAEDLY